MVGSHCRRMANVGPTLNYASSGKDLVNVLKSIPAIKQAQL